MKRGFLNTTKKKRSIAGDHTTQSNVVKEKLSPLNDDEKTEEISSQAKGKGKRNDVNDPFLTGRIVTMPARPSARQYPGWGRTPEEEFFHTVPASHGVLSKKRAVFRFWPRHPKAQIIEKMDKHRGKFSPDGYPWAETLYDIFTVRRFPEAPNLISFATGSSLLDFMKERGELDAADSEIEWAMTEGKPTVESVANTEELIKCSERRMQLFHSRTLDKENHNDNVVVEDRDGETRNSEAEHDEMEVDPASIPRSPEIPTTSPFHPNHYPAPWPLTPFESFPPNHHQLQERIPLYLLPKTLYVHDPFNVLTTHTYSSRDTSWKSRPDIVRTYHLELSDSVRQEAEEAQRIAERLEEFKARTLIVLRYKRTMEQIKNHEPVIEVPLPPYPRRLTKVGESHLYISPVSKIGEGNHSIVYKGEWELPRDLFVRPKICQKCFKAIVDEEIRRLKDTGRWAKMLNAAGWGPKGFTGCQPSKEELDEVNDPVNLEKDGEIIERELTCVVSPNAHPLHVLKVAEEKGIWDQFMENSGVNAAQLDFIQVGEEKNESPGEAVVIRVNALVGYVDNYKDCIHAGPIHSAVPRTTKFTVVSKLSLEDDTHLATEAMNYQEFPERFFHHYNGYTIINQLRAVVPVGAVVPQFYGYYVPEKGARTNGRAPYLSSILLLEYCGKPIKPHELSQDDQEECASLLLRFQNAGWLHGSFAPRNFLVQYGKPTEFPLMRGIRPEPSFRLIDFGRSRKYAKLSKKRSEEFDALRVFEKLAGSMNVTLG